MRPIYPSGAWDGFWFQAHLGRQPMRAFQLAFSPDGEVAGGGVDVVGRFVIRGRFHPDSGRVALAKQYLGKHAVLYEGGPDGEGSILGTWRIGESTGPFLIRPVVPRPGADAPILDLDDAPH